MTKLCGFIEGHRYYQFMKKKLSGCRCLAAILKIVKKGGLKKCKKCNIASPDGTEMHSKVTKNVKIFGSEGEGGKPPCDPPSFILVAGAREKKVIFLMI